MKTTLYILALTTPLITALPTPIKVPTPQDVEAFKACLNRLAEARPFPTLGTPCGDPRPSPFHEPTFDSSRVPAESVQGDNVEAPVFEKIMMECARMSGFGLRGMVEAIRASEEAEKIEIQVANGTRTWNDHIIDHERKRSSSWPNPAPGRPLPWHDHLTQEDWVKIKEDGWRW